MVIDAAIAFERQIPPSAFDGTADADRLVEDDLHPAGVHDPLEELLRSLLLRRAEDLVGGPLLQG